MKQVDDWTCWSLLLLAIVVSPVALILAVPMAIGFGLDVFDLASEKLLVAALCLPLAIGVLWRLHAAAAVGRGVVRLWRRLHLEQAADFIHAP